MKLLHLQSETVPDLNGVGFFGHDPVTRAYIARVEADGGTVDKPGCVRLGLLPLYAWSGSGVWKEYKARVEADGGTVEDDAAVCFAESLENLRSIKI